ncbi:MAG: SURF1 family protein [Microbacteriaceae bacterium]|nr:SURF1 family protein [Microbacteriaceae bacterium]MDR9443422.1 SURF1 family protein [Microbacteriaceae bacterium]
MNSFARWSGWFALVLIFATGTVFLSSWQFDRREEKVDQIELVQNNYNAPVSSLDQVVADGDLPPENEWLRAEIVGNYLTEHVYLVRNRPLNGQPGFLQLVPFETTQGQIIAIERGWMPTGNRQDSPDFIPQVEGEQKTITVRLRPNEPEVNRGAPEGQIENINLPRFSEVTGLAVEENFYGRMAFEVPASSEYANPMPMPRMDEGNHLSYALQWILFGIMSFIAFGWALRQELRYRAGKVKAKKKDFDSGVEDELLDAAESRTMQ